MEVLSRTSMTMASQAFLSTAAPRSSRASCRGVGRREIRGNLFSVQMMRCDVSLDRGRHLAHDRTPTFDVFADGARRHVGGAVQADDHPVAVEARRLEIRWLWRPAARARDHHDRGQLTNLLGLVPRAEQPGRVPPQDEEQLRTWIE